jgi:hypothetical protein
MLMLIVVDLNDLVEAIYAFYEQFPLLTSRFKFIFYLHSVMIMLSVKCNAVHAKKQLVMVFASFLVAIKHLNTSPFAFARDVVSGCPIIYH